ncbi:MAG: hypothetical protein P4L90_25710 [Rhodopila sp.]|nr:hypothetical protein [Rhodopila sp.]
MSSTTSSKTTASPNTGSSYVERKIDITITLGQGTFGQSGMNTVKLSGLRSVVNILKGGFPSMDRATVRVYGVPPSVMNSISTLGIPLPMVRHNNTVTVEAGDDTNGMSVVYAGYITNAWQDFSEVPETSLNITGWGGQDQALFPAPAISYPGTADVATILSGLATRMGWSFENGGVQVKLSNPYFAGTALEQAHNVARAANIEMYCDTSSSPITLAIWPKNSTRGGKAPLISAQSGLVGYPMFRDQGMAFRCLFNPSIRLGGQIQMQSSIGAAPQQTTGTPTQQTGGPNGSWYVIGPLVFDLSAQIPNGPWFCDVTCARTLVPQS